MQVLPPLGGLHSEVQVIVSARVGIALSFAVFGTHCASASGTSNGSAGAAGAVAAAGSTAADTGGSPASGGTTASGGTRASGGTTASGGTRASGGTTASGGKPASGGSPATGGGSTGGAPGTGGATSSGTPGVWQDVTPAGITLDPAAFSNNNFGVQDVVADPVRKSDLYAFTTYQGVWRSTDYGVTWKKVSAASAVIQSGRQWAAAIDNDVKRDATKAPALYTTNGWSTGGFYKSTDWGVTWVGSTEPGDVYSIDMDPYDNQHLIVGFHEKTGIAESTNGGATWKQIATLGTGNSIYPFFINTGNPATTRSTWIEIPQDFVGGTTYRTTNGGAAWTQVGTFVHPHGTCQIFDAGGGVVYDAGSQGVVQSKDYGVTWTQVSSPYEGAIIGTPKFLYTSSGVNFGPGYPPFRYAPRDPGTAWTDMKLPTGMFHGPKRFAVTYDGSHYVLIQGSWMSGIWRYVEP